MYSFLSLSTNTVAMLFFFSPPLPEEPEPAPPSSDTLFPPNPWPQHSVCSYLYIPTYIYIDRYIYIHSHIYTYCSAYCVFISLYIHVHIHVLLGILCLHISTYTDIDIYLYAKMYIFSDTAVLTPGSAALAHTYIFRSYLYKHVLLISLYNMCSYRYTHTHTHIYINIHI